MRVLYVPLDMSSAERAAWSWLISHPEIASVRANAADAARMAVLSRADVVWIDAAFPVPIAPAGIIALAESDGPPWLLTNGAVTLPHRLGIERAAPDVHIDRTWRDADDELFFFDTFAETPRLRGHAAFRRHSLFQGLGSGTYTWWPEEGETYRAIMYALPEGPDRARVIAVERGFIHVNETRATIWAYDAPRILCIGAHLPFDARDSIFARTRDRLARNALAWTAGRCDESRDLHWSFGEPHEDTAAATAVVDASSSAAAAAAMDLSTGAAMNLSTGAAPAAFEPLPLELATQRLPARAGDPFTLAGRRALVAGTVGGDAEVWAHPLRIMRLDAPAETELAGTASTLGLELRYARIGIEGEAATTHDVDRQREQLDAKKHAPDARASVVTRRIVVMHEQPRVVFEWSDGPVSLSWRTDLRLMWPYPAGCLGPLEWSTTSRSLTVQAAKTGEKVVFETSADVEWSVVDAAQDGSPELICRLVGPGSGPFRLTATAFLLDANEGELARGNDDARAATATTANVLANHVRARAAALRHMAHERLRVDAPEPEIGTAIEWAKVRLDSYLVDTPGVGRSLVAGYWTSRPGWNAARPGYAWYFGRDAVWTALASLAVGDFAAVRDTIEFLGAHQDLSGKILHECTTSGSVHYDAADSSPLYLLLVARFLAWTGDIAFVRAQLPRIRAALAFCVSTDTDGDGLIENTRVGHGWIEFGQLGGGKVTYYNAGIWTAALRELGTTFEDVGEHGLARETRDRARDARTALERLFHSGARRAYALKAWNPAAGSPSVDSAAGTSATGEGSSERPESSLATDSVRLGGLDWFRDFTPTATHAVPLLLGVADPDRARSWLDAVASPDFSAEWGVRMVSRLEPGFDPASYHGGAVWPLYTGWVAWAEFVAGRSEAAFAHWRANVMLAFENQAGAWEEVLHGTDRRMIGVCPDQAWSTAMAVSPFVYGLLGADPDAPRGRLRLRPQIPASWDRLEVRNLRVGEASVSLRYRHGGSTHTFTLEQEDGAVPLRVIFEPVLPAPTLVGTRIDGIEARLDPRPFGNRLMVPAQVILDHPRILEFTVEQMI